MEYMYICRRDNCIYCLFVFPSCTYLFPFTVQLTLTFNNIVLQFSKNITFQDKENYRKTSIRDICQFMPDEIYQKTVRNPGSGTVENSRVEFIRNRRVLEKTFAFGEIQIIHKLSNSCKTDHLCMNLFASNSSTLYRLIQLKLLKLHEQSQNNQE